tara:strand:+ start:627 stop:1499 length:873 start_codon:yes stop_codon:yes gene_type:complete
MNTTQTSDQSTRFLFEQADIRGETVSLHTAFGELLGNHSYSSATRRLLGEFAAAAVLISNNLKYKGRIILQARSSGLLSLVMVECTSDSEIRGIARGDIGANPEDYLSLIEAGQLAITIERNGGQRYQGIVDLEAGSLTKALDSYFLQSEQLHTRFWLAADQKTASGMMLQQLPAQLVKSPEDRENHWQRVCAVAETLSQAELIELSAPVVLHRLYHEESVRLFDPQPICFNCSCSRERSLNVLASLGSGELAEILDEQNVINMNCEMCGSTYEFKECDLTGLAQSGVLH